MLEERGAMVNGGEGTVQRLYSWDKIAVKAKVGIDASAAQESHLVQGQMLRVTDSIQSVVKDGLENALDCRNLWRPESALVSLNFGFLEEAGAFEHAVRNARVFRERS